ncbi:pectin lyase-like protein [Acephala macrosclerotiorum]|nr:pectin lyase-like protein [Acephala macrosclerotiorum]
MASLKSFSALVLLVLTFTSSVLAASEASPHGKAPTKPGNNDSRPTWVVRTQLNSTDDTPAILDAFKHCGQGGSIVFLNQTYNINSIMNTTGLKDCEINIYGTFLNQSSAWFLAGNNIKVRGHSYGTLDGNGQIWYDFVSGVPNYPYRPHALTIWNTTNSNFEGSRFVQSQIRIMTVIHSQNVLLQDIYVNSTSHGSKPARNTDGADTMFSDHITFKRWTVVNGDDSISLKANSSNIIIQDSTFYKGLGVAIGSIGQYKDVFETIENTWDGQQVGYPPNGGCGGLGHAQNFTSTNFKIQNTTKTGTFYITQCTTFSGVAGDCNTSLFNLRDIHFTNITGDVGTSYIASMQCSADSPCSEIDIEDVNLTDVATPPHTTTSLFKYTNVLNTTGFKC